MRGRAVVVALLCCLITAFAAESASAGKRTYARFGAKKQYKPVELFFGAHSFVTGVSWTTWGKKRAEGTGSYQYNDCVPSCAEGTTTPITSTVILTGRDKCGNYFIFHRLKVIYPLGGVTKKTGTTGVCSAKN